MRRREDIFYHFTTDEHELAYRFSRILRQWLKPAEIDRINADNAAETDKTVCHSHDLCDPNQAMLDAMAELKIKFKAQSKKQAQLINDAWSIAKAAGFDFERIYREGPR